MTTLLIKNGHVVDPANKTDKIADVFIKDGKRYHHIIDPKTGEPSIGMMSATVIAPLAVHTDGYSTAVFIQGQDKGIETLRKVRGELPQEADDLYGPVFGLAEKSGRRGISAERVAEVVEHALCARKPKIRYLVGSDAKSVSFFRKLPARFRDWVISRKLPTYP